MKKRIEDPVETRDLLFSVEGMNVSLDRKVRNTIQQRARHFIITKSHAKKAGIFYHMY